MSYLGLQQLDYIDALADPKNAKQLQKENATNKALTARTKENRIGPENHFRLFQLFLAVAYLGQGIGYIVVASKSCSNAFVPIFNTFLDYNSAAGVAFLNTQHYTNIEILWCGVAVFLISGLISLTFFLVSFCVKDKEYGVYPRIIEWPVKRSVLLGLRAIVDALLYVLVGFQVGIWTVSSSILLAAIAYAKVASLVSFDPHDDEGRPTCWERVNAFAVALVCGIFVWIAVWWQFAMYRAAVTSDIQNYIPTIVGLAFFFYVCLVVVMIIDFTKATSSCFREPRDKCWQLVFYELVFFSAITVISWLGYVEVCYHPQRTANSICGINVMNPYF